MTSRDSGDPVQDALAIADREWRAMHLVDQDRASLAEDLRAELVAAAGDGMTPQQLLGADIRVVARALAVEAGAELVPYHHRRLLLAAAAGAAPGAALGWLGMFGGGLLPVPAGVVWYVPPVVLAGVLLAVRLRLADVPRIGRTVAAMALLIPAAGILVAPVLVGFAALTGYSTNGVVVGVEVATAAAAAGGATLLARRWALLPWKATHPGRVQQRPAVEPG